MSRKRKWFHESVILATSLVVLLVSIPLFAVMTVVGRAVILALLGTAVVGGALLFAFHPRFREWLGVQVVPVIEHKGLRMGADVAFDRGHAWARLGARRAVVGVDDLVQATLGPVESVELPEPGTEVRRGEPLFVLRRGERSIEVRAPLSGTVTETNSRVRERPELVNEQPFGDGWTVMIRGGDLAADKPRLLRGGAAQDWFRNEVDRLIELLEPAAVPALADGGALVEGLYRYVDEPAWRRLQESFFAQE
jgi:glycine cleavage system H protein